MSSASRSATSRSTSTTTTRHAAGGGVRIARIRYQLLAAKLTKRLRVLVTLRDSRHRLVRFPIVSVGRLAGAKRTLPGARVGFSNRKGQATFVVPLTRSLLGQRLLLRIGARTPHAHTIVVAAVRVLRKRPATATLRQITYE